MTNAIIVVNAGSTSLKFGTYAVDAAGALPLLCRDRWRTAASGRPHRRAFRAPWRMLVPAGTGPSAQHVLGGGQHGGANQLSRSNLCPRRQRHTEAGCAGSVQRRELGSDARETISDTETIPREWLQGEAPVSQAVETIESIETILLPPSHIPSSEGESAMGVSPPRL